MSERILSQHFEKSLDKLQAFYSHSSIAKHGDLKGIAREGFVKIFLKNNLPSILEYNTGEIIDCNDNRSGQIDIILQSSFSPKINLFDGINIAFNDHVLGCIEVKSNLNDQHLNKALEAFLKIKRLHRDIKIKEVPGWNKDKQPIIFHKSPCFLVAFEGLKKDTLVAKLEEFGKNNNLEFDEYPEIITVINQEYTLVKDDGWLYAPNIPRNKYKWIEGKECLVDLYQYVEQLTGAWAENHRYGSMPIGKFFQSGKRT